MKIKAILDTNVFISGVFWKGPPFEILKREVMPLNRRGERESNPITRAQLSLHSELADRQGFRRRLRCHRVLVDMFEILQVVVPSELQDDRSQRNNGQRQCGMP